MHDTHLNSGLVAHVRRDSVEQDIVSVLDDTEAVYRHVKECVVGWQWAMTEGQVDALTRYLGEAYRALSNARHAITDAKNDDL